MEEKEFGWLFLPEGLEEYFDIEMVEKSERHFRVILV
jgi:hypothetical protein